MTELTSGGERLRYDPEHWPRVEDPAKALELYLELGRRPLNRTKHAVLSRLLPGDLSGRRVLDYGAGAGAVTVLCAQRGARVVAVDAETPALRTAAYYAARQGVAERCRFVQGETLPESLAQESFDVIVAKDVIEHVPDDEGLLRDFARRQPSGGLLLVSTQSALSLTYLIESLYYRKWLGQTSWCGWDPTHLRFYTPGSLAARLRRAGYQIVKRQGVYIVPYRLPTYALLFKRWIEIPALRYIDLWVGDRFPLNLFGWDVIVLARKS